MRLAIGMIADGNSNVALFTASVQVVHLVRLAHELGRAAEVRRSLNRMVVASIGPTTSEMLREYGITADLEPEHPKMAALVKAAAERSGGLLSGKRTSALRDYFRSAPALARLQTRDCTSTALPLAPNQPKCGSPPRPSVRTDGRGSPLPVRPQTEMKNKFARLN